MKLTLPEKLTRSETIVVSVLLIVILALVVIFVVPWVFPSVTHTEPEVGSTVIDVERQKPIKAKFDLRLFTDPRWKNLKRVSGEVGTGELGRPNPFAPVVPAEPDVDPLTSGL